MALNGKPVADIYERPGWDKILEGKNIDVRYKPSAKAKARDITVAISELIP